MDSLPDSGMITFPELGRNPAPFDLHLDDLKNGGEPVHCVQAVRALPGRRLVCRGEWQGRAVFAKLYFGTSRARRHWQREVSGLEALHSHDIPTAAVLYHGTANNGQAYAIILAAITPASEFLQDWEAADPDTRQARMSALLELFARHHGAGLDHRDPHLNNFLLSGDRIVTLDGGAIVAQPGALPQRESVQSLGRLLAQFYPDVDGMLPAALPVYLQRRGWQSRADIEGQVRAQVRVHRRRRRDQYLKKIFRECSEFICQRDWRRLVVFPRAVASDAFSRFTANPDATLRAAGSVVLKDGNTCTVWRCRVDGRSLVVKRYNIKDAGHALGRAMRASRAAVSWRNAHRLRFYGIRTPQPVALVEQRWGPLRGRAWYVCEWLEGRDCLSVLTDPGGDTETRTEAIDGVSGLLRQLSALSIFHGDLKATNLVLDADGAAILDLDAMHEYANPAWFRWRHRSDVRRFLRNWESRPEIAVRFREAMQLDGTE